MIFEHSLTLWYSESWTIGMASGHGCDFFVYLDKCSEIRMVKAWQCVLYDVGVTYLLWEAILVV